MPRKQGNSPLYRFPRSNSADSTSSTGSNSEATSSPGLASPSRSSSSSSIEGLGDYDKELGMRDEVRGNCIGRTYCKCMNCYTQAMGDFVFETQEEFEVYFEVLRETLANRADGSMPTLHCHPAH